MLFYDKLYSSQCYLFVNLCDVLLFDRHYEIDNATVHADGVTDAENEDLCLTSDDINELLASL